ncbi:hypothetical protein E4U41_000830 [Claviceps citrina]|nr:hypothetical protein E4U41_000830 [Claviceps citrina]
MRSLEETRSRWQTTQKYSASVDELQRAVRYNGSCSPCLSGCRSVCWKVFLLSTTASLSSWMDALEGGRRDYQERRDHFLKYIRHPEALAELAVDPLADDPESPWNTVRQDEIIRAEIQQDVQRLPDEVNYHEQRIQGMILDILFIYCRINPDRGGYRQGMHELLAPLVYALEQDSIDRGVLEASSELDQTMLGVLDVAFIEHDAYILFSRLMEHAQSFYEVADGTLQHTRPGTASSMAQEQRSTIVERSKYIHEVCLGTVDPELAAHLSDVEILPQIFIISVLEADYSGCLQLLLKYPGPEQPHGPHTFVDDAAYLRNHLDRTGGSSLIMKYTGKMPEPAKNKKASSRSRNGGRTARSRLTSPSRFMQQQPSMETLLQGAAKSANRMLEKGEKLGINQAVRDAMGEIRRNVQSFNEVRQAQRSPTSVLSGESAAMALAAMQRRNKQLASLLRETVANLKTVTVAESDNQATSLELIEMAAAKIQFVQIYLEDSSLEVPTFPTAAGGSAAIPALPQQKEEQATMGPVDSAEETSKGSTTNAEDETDTGTEDKQPDPGLPDAPGSVDTGTQIRPAAVPTRSTLAQSSFAWMLEPDQPRPPRGASDKGSRRLATLHRKRASNNMRREQNAFLFGEGAAEGVGAAPLHTDDIFGLEPLPKPKDREVGE